MNLFYYNIKNKKVEAKYENDLMIDRLLAKETQNEAEKEALKKYFLSKQQETNESLINEQKKTIDILKWKCQNYEKEFKKVSNFDNDISQVNFNELKDEINGLKNIIYHLNIELSAYQAKYSPPNINEVNIKFLNFTFYLLAIMIY